MACFERKSFFADSWFVIQITCCRAQRCLWRKNVEKKIRNKKISKNFFYFLVSYNILAPHHTWVSTKKFQPNRSSRLAGYWEHICMNVLFYYIDLIYNISTLFLKLCLIWFNIGIRWYSAEGIDYSALFLTIFDLI